MTKNFHELTHKEMSAPRYLRATRFANTMLSIMRDFVPAGRDCQHLMYDYLLQLGYETNAELINVPPEWDELTKLQLEKAMLETHPLWIKDSPLAGKETP